MVWACRSTKMVAVTSWAAVSFCLQVPVTRRGRVVNSSYRISSESNMKRKTDDGWVHSVIWTLGVKKKKETVMITWAWHHRSKWDKAFAMVLSGVQLWNMFCSGPHPKPAWESNFFFFSSLTTDGKHVLWGEWWLRS